MSKEIKSTDVPLEPANAPREPFLAQIGDTVKLKSGGPTMTVVATPVPGEDPDNRQCQWFNPSDGKLCIANFSLKVLAPE